MDAPSDEFVAHLMHTEWVRRRPRFEYVRRRSRGTIEGFRNLRDCYGHRRFQCDPEAGVRSNSVWAGSQLLAVDHQSEHLECVTV